MIHALNNDFKRCTVKNIDPPPLPIKGSTHGVSSNILACHNDHKYEPKTGLTNFVIIVTLRIILYNVSKSKLIYNIHSCSKVL